jgi:copper transporter 1
LLYRSWALKPSRGEQAIRALFHGVQYFVALLIMLIAMSFNGYVLFAIFFGAIVGYALVGDDTLPLSPSGEIGGCC